MRAIVLPGLDGSSTLSSELCAHLDGDLDVEAVDFPSDQPLDYGRLEAWIRAALPGDGGGFVVVAQSFSGPVAIRLAADPPPRLRAVVLAATFAEAPAPRSLRLLFARPSWLPSALPAFAIRRYLTGEDASDALVDAVRDAVRALPPEVLAHRVQQVLEVDVRAELRRARVPVLVLEGTGDRLVSRRRSVGWARPDLPLARLDAPHLVLQRAALEAAREIRRFTAGL
mgnify:CR=1 FL=1